MIRVVIIGCGKIADSHAAQIKRIPGCEIVGACDREELMAKQLCERFSINKYFCNVEQMIQDTDPNVVHIATPPSSHFELGILSLEAGCNVYIEKPFTANAKEAIRLLSLAENKNLKVTVGHDSAFHHAERRMRELIRNGYLGGAPIHMESYYCYDLSDAYARALTGDKNHWVRKLPGKLLQNIISHGICKIAEYLRDDNPRIIAHGFTSNQLTKLGEAEIYDELRVIIYGSDCTTAYFTFSSQMKPSLHQFRIYGPRNGLVIDHHNQTCIKLPGERYISYIDKFIPPLLYAGQYTANTINNVSLLLKNDFHMKSGMKFLIESFYRSILEDTPPPIPYREIILTAKIMDSIFMQLNDERNLKMVPVS